MLFQTKQIKGEGRGHHIGFPTINLTVPNDFILDEGIYAAWIVINDKTYKGALHYGPIPTFDLKEKVMEVHLLDITDDTIPNTENVLIEVDIVERIRDIKKFIEAEDLSFQIAKDIEKVNLILR
jgi:riboflavin kinase/FMN adenylyltransferase